ncbi:MAG: asparagine synthase [Betaproteobacteria bacterium HGW-Betaproteobacteria-4]|nr:MAG: asparagine synthase [Betaproteobacteria bacterium HGW-Betaproteobacteria-4]
MAAPQLIHISGSPRLPNGKLLTDAGQEALEAWQRIVDGTGGQGLADVAGDFSVALAMPDGRIVFAIDRFAVRTLCYRVSAGKIELAPRADELAGSAQPIDPQAIFDYLYFHAIPSPRTIYQNVLRLPPGHFGVFDNGRLSIQPYWKPTFTEGQGAFFDTLRDEFRGLLHNATARHLDGCKAGCFLSGGTDSSTVAGMIGEVTGKPAATYSIGFEAEGYDEMEFARLVARHFKTEHHEYYVTPDDLVRSIPEVARSYDQPFGNSSALPAYYCARMAKEDGITRILAGDGGDELFGGNTRYAKHRIFDLYQCAPGFIRKGLIEPIVGMPGAAGISLLRKAASYTEQANTPMPDRLEMYNLIKRLGIERVFTKPFLEQVDLQSPLNQQREVWASPETGSATNRHLAFDWRYTLAESDLPKVLGTTRLAGIDVGFPMLDSELLAFSMRLPVDYKLKGTKLRWFFKEALRGFLPDEVLTKKKQGFGLPFGVWATRHEPLRKL